MWCPFLAASAHTVETTIDEYPGVSGITTARDAMRNLSEEDKDKIAAQVKPLVPGHGEPEGVFGSCYSFDSLNSGLESYSDGHFLLLGRELPPREGEV